MRPRRARHCVPPESHVTRRNGFAEALEVLEGADAPETSNGGRLVGIQARAVMYLAGLQHCYEPTCSPVPVVVVNLLYSEQRSSEPSHNRAGLTSIGLEIKRTPLSNQTSPRQAPSHSFKASKPASILANPTARRVNSSFKVCIAVVIFRVEASVSSDSPTGLPGHNHSSVRSNRETTDYEAPSGVLVRSKVCQTAFHRRNDFNE
ncbi:hypothetical protein GBF38_009047 [Nibea albiflora]|uniref:Uncharacterized protein n=1 Tax=Nibea albiflora TaxID=240163 RepID=A0ACB7ER39_NIBAL|nr:hypothetical protein GBF38_009047 [Nibea albiflora]